MRHRSGLGAAGRKKGKGKDKEPIDDIIDAPALAGPASLVGLGGHINLLQDPELVQSSFSRSAQAKKEAEETEKGVPLGPSAQDLRPWYVAGSSSFPDPKGKNKETGKGDKPWEERRRMKQGARSKDFFWFLGDEESPTPPPRATIAADGIMAVVAGSDTTATTLMALWYFLLRHPEARARLDDTCFPDLRGEGD
ncbi:hypothetical protein FIBSPDRAFT_304744 [Athelia psychrophila]|uniref:Cytochrome P450 n=1 Tax=Athelia psychrophila TaxID=1759441 RepID=A0A167X0J5_9AGAM|nr:hypothetical protein FIBSPDRAFT_304744 [Fibularhizoctonia sp. CBS 109695]